MAATETKIQKPEEWFDTILPQKVAKNPEKIGGFAGTFSFSISGDNGGEWAVTIQGTNLEVKKGMDPASAFTISMKDENFVKLMNGELNGQMAFMTGKLKFKGNMGTAVKLQGLLF
jgi:putative sterol carrier protein